MMFIVRVCRGAERLVRILIRNILVRKIVEELISFQFRRLRLSFIASTSLLFIQWYTVDPVGKLLVHQ